MRPKCGRTLNFPPQKGVAKLIGDRPLYRGIYISQKKAKNN